MSRFLPRLFALLAACTSLPLAAAAFDSPLGGWQATERGQDSTTIIELYLDEDGALAGRIVRIVDGNGQTVSRNCAHCAGELKGKPLAGMRFLWGLHEQNGRWVGGKVIDLRDGLTQGVVANAELVVEQDQLTLHAYLGVRALGQSRTWQRLVAPLPAAAR